MSSHKNYKILNAAKQLFILARVEITIINFTLNDSSYIVRLLISYNKQLSGKYDTLY